jgi:Zn-dependent oligopeptidase
MCAQDAVFPLYDQVKAEHVVPGMRALLKQLHAEIDALEASGERFWWWAVGVWRGWEGGNGVHWW